MSRKGKVAKESAMNFKDGSSGALETITQLLC